LTSKGPDGARCKLHQVQIKTLQAELDAGPAAHGWDDQCWTLTRINELIASKFKISYTVRGVGYLLHRLGWSWQVPARQAAERDEGAIAAWREETWPAIKRRRRTWVRGCVSKMKPVRGSGRRRAAPGPDGGRTPVVKVCVQRSAQRPHLLLAGGADRYGPQSPGGAGVQQLRRPVERLQTRPIGGEERGVRLAQPAVVAIPIFRRSTPIRTCRMRCVGDVCKGSVDRLPVAVVPQLARP
jgi:hypothetical protein